MTAEAETQYVMQNEFRENKFQGEAKCYEQVHNGRGSFICAGLSHTHTHTHTHTHSNYISQIGLQ